MSRDKSIEKQRLSLYNQSRTADNYYSRQKNFMNQNNKDSRTAEQIFKQKFAPGGSCTESFHNKNQVSGFTTSKIGSGNGFNSSSKINKLTKNRDLNK